MAVAALRPCASPPHVVSCPVRRFRPRRSRPCWAGASLRRARDHGPHGRTGSTQVKGPERRVAAVLLCVVVSKPLWLRHRPGPPPSLSLSLSLRRQAASAHWARAVRGGPPAIGHEETTHTRARGVALPPSQPNKSEPHLARRHLAPHIAAGARGTRAEQSGARGRGRGPPCRPMVAVSSSPGEEREREREVVHESRITENSQDNNAQARSSTSPPRAQQRTRTY